MEKISKRPKYRAIELYAKDSPFKPKVIPDKREDAKEKDSWYCDDCGMSYYNCLCSHDED